MSLPDQVKIVEVSPRDGLQNESQLVSAETKIALINRLSECGIQVIESASFVSEKWIPQMADSDKVMTGITRKHNVHYPVLVPNVKGLENALVSGVDEVAVFGAASESFSQRNINCSISESLERFRLVCDRAHQENIRVRGYISCVLDCPYEGKVDPTAVVHVAKSLEKMGCQEISLGDSTGTGTPRKARQVVEAVAEYVPITNLAVHFHDTYGQALANIYACLELGINIVDSSVAGLGGCPYAPGASGNVATEDVVYMLNGLGIESGIDLPMLIETGKFISGELGRVPASKVSVAWK